MHSCIYTSHLKMDIFGTSWAHFVNYGSYWTRGLIYPLAAIICVLLSLLCCSSVSGTAGIGWCLCVINNRESKYIVFSMMQHDGFTICMFWLALASRFRIHASQATSSKGALKGPHSPSGQQVSLKSFSFFLIRLKPGMRHGASVVARVSSLKMTHFCWGRG